MTKLKTLTISAKASDLFSAQVVDENDETYEYDGYVPDDIGIGGGDYVEIEINAQTGQIQGWKPLTLNDWKAVTEDEFYDDLYDDEL